MGEPESDETSKKGTKGPKGFKLLSIVEKIREKTIHDDETPEEDKDQDGEVVVIDDDDDENTEAIKQSLPKNDIGNVEKTIEPEEKSDVETPIVQILPEETDIETPMVEVVPEESNIETPIVQILPEETDIETPIVQILPEEADIETPVVEMLPKESNIETPIVQILPEEDIETPVVEMVPVESYIETPIVQILPEEADIETPVVEMVPVESNIETPIVQIIPEETPMVQILPEGAADEEMAELNENEGSQNESPNEDDLPEFVECTACGTRMKPSRRKLCKHSVLGVIICKRCSKFYNSSPFTRDELGMEEYCKWCADGGKLICCDFCEKSYCRPCLRRNLGKEFLKVLLGAESTMKWKCFVCDPSQLEAYKRECDLVMKILDKLKLKEYIFENKKTHLGGPNQLTRLERLHNITGCITIDGDDTKEKLNQKIDMACKVLTEDKSEQLNDTNNEIESKEMKTEKQELEESDDDDVVVIPIKERPPPEVLEVLSDDGEIAEKESKKESISETAEPMLEGEHGEDSSSKASDYDEEEVLSDSNNDETESHPSVNLKDFNIVLERVDIPVSSRNKSALSENVLILSSDEEGAAKDQIDENAKDQADETSINKMSEDESDNEEILPKIEEISPKPKMTARKSSHTTKVSKIKESKIKESKIKESNKLFQLRIRPSDKEHDKEKSSESNSEEGIANIPSSDDSDIDLAKVRNRSIRRQETETVEKQSTKTVKKQTAETTEKQTAKTVEKEAAKTIEKQSVEAESSDDQLKNKRKSRRPEKKSKHEKSDEEMNLSDDKDADVKVEKDEEDSSVESEASEKEMDTSEHDSNDGAVNSSDEGEKQVKGRSKRLRKGNGTSESGSGIDNVRLSKRMRKNRASSPQSSDKESENDDDDKGKKKGKGIEKGKQKGKGKKGEVEIISSSDNDEAESDVDNKSKSKSKWKNRASSPLSSDNENKEDDDKKKGKGKAKQKGKGKKGKAAELSSDEDSDSGGQNKRKPKRRRRNRASSPPSSDEESENDNAKRKKKGKGKGKAKGKGKGKGKGKRKGKAKESSSEDEDVSPSKGRKKIRRILADDELTEETRHARQLEEDRRKRLLEKTQTPDEIEAEIADANAFVLEKEKDTGKPIVTVHQSLTEHLKPHQKEGIQFLYNAVVESVDNWKKGNGGGALLAHCMGLGKTLQVIAFAHTLYTHEAIALRNILVVAPLNVVMNWQTEFEKWLSVDERLDVYCLTDAGSNMWRRVDMLQDWMTYGGVLILGYEMYRNLTQMTRIRSKKQKKIITESLVDPGPELVICDEGHVMRNEMSAISKQLSKIKTLKRVVLTGTPLQNNLGEYHVMVSFVKPNLLGTRKEFQNRFVNPISNGQCSNSTPGDVMIMKQRCHVLHEMLSGCVQRKDYTVLTPFLTPKHEFTIFVRLCDKQVLMYKKYIETFVCKSVSEIKGRGMSLFSDYQCLMRIWTHPWALKVEAIRRLERAKYNSDDSINEFINDSDSDKEHSAEEKGGKWKAGSDSSDFGAANPKTKRKRKITESPVSEVEESSDESSEKENISESSSSSDDEVKESQPVSTTRAYPQRSSRSQNQEVAKNKKVIKDNLSKRRVASMVLLDDSDVSDGVSEVKTEKKGTDSKVGDKKKATDSNDAGKKKATDSTADKTPAELLHGNTRSGTVFKETTLGPGDLPDDDEKEWYDEFLEAADEYNVELSGKFVILLEILADAEVVGDKVLVFSQSLVSLDLIESALGGGSIGGNDENWCKGVDYFRMDGSTPPQTRQRYAEIFNDPDNTTSRLFLISTRAGSLGINMVAANRVIIFDCSWNPSHDVQSVFRVYRFGQSKPCYVYRLISQGTMEEKIYDRQITKLAMAGRVVDEQQIERHFSSEQIRELYTFTPEEYDDKEKRPTPQLPKDPVLAEVLQRLHQKWIVKYHEHDLLLENLEEESLTEEQRKQAWSNYEAEKDSASRNIERTQLDQQRRAQILEEYRRHAELQQQQQQQEHVRQRQVYQALIERQQQQVAMVRLAQQQQQQRAGAASFSGYRQNLGRPPLTPLAAHFGALAPQEQLRQIANINSPMPSLNPIGARTGSNMLYRLKVELPPGLANSSTINGPLPIPGTVIRVPESRMQGPRIPGLPPGLRFPTLNTSTYIPPRP